MYHIYRVTNKVNGKHYIGLSRSVNERWRNHKTSAIKVSKGAKLGDDNIQVIHLALAKYGIENFEFKILEEVDTLEQSNIREDYWAEHFNSKVPYGYNVGSCGNVKPVSEEIRKKISKANTGKKRTPEQNKAQSERSKGRVTSEETKKKLSEVHMGREVPWCKGKPIPEERKRRISKTLKGRPAKNRKLTMEKVGEIRDAYNGGAAICALARQFGVTRTIINGIVYNKTYKQDGNITTFI